MGRKNEPGVYVSEIVKGGAAEADGRLATGDQVWNLEKWENIKAPDTMQEGGSLYLALHIVEFV